jgi:hypothetical protein
MVIGIICGVVGIVVIGGLVWKCHKDKASNGEVDSFADDLYTSFIDTETA